VIERKEEEGEKRKTERGEKGENIVQREREKEQTASRYRTLDHRGEHRVWMIYQLLAVNPRPFP
jgi:hypothetical protein